MQVVLPEDLCDRLTALADREARTVSNMARVLIQQGVERLEREGERAASDRMRASLGRQGRGGGAGSGGSRRLRGAPTRLRLPRG